jgi:hypothetical protein
VRITSIKPNKNSPVPQKILKMLPSWLNALSTTVKNISVYCLEFFSRNCWNFTACTYHTPNTNFFIVKWEFMRKSSIFCTPIRAVLRIHPSTKTKPHQRKTNCGSTSPSCTD